MKKVRDDFAYKLRLKGKIVEHRRKLKTINKLLEKKLFISKKEAKIKKKIGKLYYTTFSERKREHAKKRSLAKNLALAYNMNRPTEDD